MVLKDMDLQPDALCYIGAIKGSGFFWIGHRKNVPEQYLGTPIAETDRRTVDAPGTIILLEGDCKEFFGGKEPPGYWYWYECDPSAPKPVEGRLHGSPANFESLLVGIAKTEGYWYKNELRKALDSVHHDMDRAEAEELVRNVQTVCRPHLVLLPESSVGQYIIQRIEDEAVARGICPRAKWVKMKFETRHNYLDRTVKKFVQERVRKDDHKHYATIKGRSVKHDTL